MTTENGAGPEQGTGEPEAIQSDASSDASRGANLDASRGSYSAPARATSLTPAVTTIHHGIGSERRIVVDEQLVAADGSAPTCITMRPEDLTYEQIKSAIYEFARQLIAAGREIRELTLSPEIFEILDKRLVFRPPAKQAGESSDERLSRIHFITPYGILIVREAKGSHASQLSPFSFCIV